MEGGKGRKKWCNYLIISLIEENKNKEKHYNYVVLIQGLEASVELVFTESEKCESLGRAKPDGIHYLCTLNSQRRDWWTITYLIHKHRKTNYFYKFRVICNAKDVTYLGQIGNDYLK